VILKGKIINKNN